MITARRDYMMRVIEEVGRILARLSFKRRKGGDTDDNALESVIFGLQRLFDLPPDQIFRLTPAQHYDLLVRDEPPEFARDKVLLYAALYTEAGHAYMRMKSREKAAITFGTALQFVLKARTQFPVDGWPEYAPSVTDLLDALGDAPLDPETTALLNAATLPEKL